MKRFIVKQSARATGRIRQEVFTVDDQDAWLFRSYVWNLTYGGKDRPFLQRRLAAGVYEQITRVIARPEDDDVIAFANNDPTDLRKANLLCITKAESAAAASRAQSAKLAAEKQGMKP